jgi:hypothetical protein
MGFHIGLRLSPKRGLRITKSFSIGHFLFWIRKGKIKGSVRS